MKNKFFILIGYILASFLCFTGCDNDNDVAATAINVEPATLFGLDLKIGDVVTLTATLDPSNATTDNYFWIVENETVATVQGNGLTATVTCVGNGRTNIIVYSWSALKHIPIQVGDNNAYLDLANVPGGNVEFTWSADPAISQYMVILSETSGGPAVYSLGPFTGNIATVPATEIDKLIFPDDTETDLTAAVIDPADWRKTFYWRVESADGATTVGQPRLSVMVKKLPYPAYVGKANVIDLMGLGFASTDRDTYIFVDGVAIVECVVTGMPSSPIPGRNWHLLDMGLRDDLLSNYWRGDNRSFPNYSGLVVDARGMLSFANAGLTFGIYTPEGGNGNDVNNVAYAARVEFEGERINFLE